MNDYNPAKEQQLPKDQTDFVGAGFKRVEHYTPTPPRIKWGEIYKDKKDQDKIIYLEKLASAMNHAADMIQRERDQLLELCQKKEDQIKSLDASLRQNNIMIQGEITRQNELKQESNNTIQELGRRIRELESNGDHC